MPKLAAGGEPRGLSGRTPGPEAEGRTIGALLEYALEHDGFEIYYQPLYTVRDGSFTEAEALVRLKGPDGALIPPDRFIPAAERTGRIAEIGRLVLERACGFLRDLLSRRAGIDAVSVNLSVAQLMEKGAVPRLLEIIRESGISPNRILFEITESILIRNYAAVSEKIRRLHEAGVQFALDDFGTGYSNIANVIDLPFDIVKIDKSLIWDSVKNRRCNRMIRDLTKTFHNIDLTVTAEGVETEEHDRFVRQCGCDKIQGFRYARPMPVGRAADYFERTAGK